MLAKMKPAIFLFAVIVATVIACSKENQQSLKNTEDLAAAAASKGDSTHLPGDSTHLPGDSTHVPGDSTHVPGDSTHVPGDSTHFPHDTIPHFPHDTIPHYPHDSTGTGDTTVVPPVDTLTTRRKHS